MNLPQGSLKEYDSCRIGITSHCIDKMLLYLQNMLLSKQEARMLFRQPEDERRKYAEETLRGALQFESRVALDSDGKFVISIRNKPFIFVPDLTGKYRDGRIITIYPLEGSGSPFQYYCRRRRR